LKFHKDSLKIDAEKVVEDLCATIRRQIRKDCKKSGAVVGISGGIDSSVCAALCTKALGPNRVLGVMMPETDSASESETLARELAGKFGLLMTGGTDFHGLSKPQIEMGEVDATYALVRAMKAARDQR